ncbi:ArpU family phage packaging/lysis transcriptional regulator, partial [Streptococcus agalactiae]
ERLALNRVSAEQELEAIEQSVSMILDPEKRRILYEKYLSPYKNADKVIYTELCMSESFYYDTLDAA